MLGMFIVVVPGCGGKGAPPAVFGSGLQVVPASPEIRKLERAMFERVNRDRAAQQLPPLTYDERLAEIARSHSADMRNNGFFDHVSPTTGDVDARLVRAGYLALEARENLAEAPDVERAEDDLLQSPPHHANIMATTVTHIGIGIVQGGVRDPRNLTVTQVLARPGKHETPAAARRALVERISRERARLGLGSVRLHPQLEALAESEIDRVADEPTPGDLERVGKAGTQAVARRKIQDIKGVSVGGQLIADSSQFELSSALLRPGVRYYGIAVRQVTIASGRPMLKVLVLVGL